MPVAPNHSANLPREFAYCPHCLKKGVYRYGGTLVTAADGSLDGLPPGHRCKYCRKPHPDNMSRETYRARINAKLEG